MSDKYNEIPPAYPEKEHLVSSTHPTDVDENPHPGIMGHIRRATAAFHKMTKLDVLAMVVCVLMCVAGMSGQLITLNMWVGNFPSELVKNGKINVPFTILTLSSTSNALFYTVGFIIWTVVKGAKWKFLCTKKAQFLSFGVGWSIALNGVFVVSATPNTPEVIQAFLLSTAILWTFLFVKVIFGEKRSYNNPLIYISFLLSLGGILVGSASKFSGKQKMDAQTAAWTALFAFGMVPGAVNNVIGTKFMRFYTLSPDELAREERRKDVAAQLLSNGADEDGEAPAELVGTDANSAKFAMLAMGNIWQVITIAAMLPVGAIPWFGSSPNVETLGTTLLEGWKCTVGIPEGCGHSWIYFMLFNLMFILSTVGTTFLNYYSPAMTSMIQQLASPLTALALIIFPTLNVQGKKINIPESVGAVLLITIGSLCYTAWEESTRHADIVRARSERSKRSIKSGQITSKRIQDVEEGHQYGATSV